MSKATKAAVVLATLLGPAVTGGYLVYRWDDIVHPATVEEAGPAKTQITPKARAWDYVTQEIDNVARDLREERAELNQRAKDLEAVSKRIAAEREELTRVRAEIEGLRGQITEAVPVLQTTETQNLKSLAKIYATMKPAQAVTILMGMDENSVVKLLSIMKPDAVSQILAEMGSSVGPAGPLAPKAALFSEKLRLLKKEPPPES